ncbi:hypothetical protein U9M48_013220 [Paspalum notatum var. saurae]|uniref:Uncharacterized protein n=1 Tax=Paspalum notatum var. saurae TaxID=547442 RepID=A0AAQ3SZK9_PASNO
MSFYMSICCMLSSAFHLHPLHTSAFVCTHICTFHSYRSRDQRRNGVGPTPDRGTGGRAGEPAADR